nr:hypothetical protein [Tanacetum cinerariifolium]
MDLDADDDDDVEQKRANTRWTHDEEILLIDNRWTKIKKSSKEAKPYIDLRSKENKSSSTSKDASKSQHKSFGKSAHVEEPSHTIEHLGVQQDKEFDTVNNDEQPAEKEVTKVDWFKKPERPPTPDLDWSKRQKLTFDLLRPGLVKLHIKIPNMTQEILVGPAFNLLKGTCKSITKLEYHFEECSKATIEHLDWHDPENKPYPYDLKKPLLLIQDHRGLEIIPQDYFINNNLVNYKDSSLKLTIHGSRRIEIKVKYDQHAYIGTSHWGPKRQSFYWYASNMTSSKDVYSRRRIITVTRLKIMKKYDYDHLEETEVRRDDQKLYTFKEGDFKRLLRRKRLMYADELYKFSDGTLNHVRSALHDIAAGIRMKYLPMRK